MILNLPLRLPCVVLPVILGLTASWVIASQQQHLAKQDALIAQLRAARQVEENAKGPVVYAARDIPEGEDITADALEQKEEFLSKIPDGALTTPVAAVGGQAAYPIQQGKVLMRNAVKICCFRPHWPEGRIKDGFRAVSFSVAADAAVAGFVSPGAHIDIFCLTTTLDRTKALPVLSDVEVLAVGTTLRKSTCDAAANHSNLITVLATPDDAEKLLDAVAAGKPYLMLRNQKDHTPLATVDVTCLWPKPPKCDE